MKNKNRTRPGPPDPGIAVARDQPRPHERSSLKFVFLTRVLNYGGAERQLVTLAKGLHNRGDRVVVAVFHRGGEMEPDLRRAGVPVVVLDKSGRWGSLGFLSRLVKLIREEQPDVVSGYFILPNILALLLRLSFPRTRAVWGMRDSDLDLNRFDCLERIIHRGQCMLARFADLIIVNSHAGLAHACTRGFPREKMIFVPNGIDTEYFKADEEGRRELRVAWRINSGEKLIGLVGRLDPMKGHPVFLEAAAALARRHDDLRFVCVGDGPLAYRQELEEKSERLGLGKRIVWARARRDMPVVYSALDINVSSSYREGSPNVIGEAMACGVPCVVTDVGDSA
ncbi:MAG: glycosyltransferase [Acidobacteriota bacterium]